LSWPKAALTKALTNVEARLFLAESTLAPKVFLLSVVLVL
jgi:hypothetical protein